MLNKSILNLFSRFKHRYSIATEVFAETTVVMEVIQAFIPKLFTEMDIFIDKKQVRVPGRHPENNFLIKGFNSDFEIHPVNLVLCAKDTFILINH